MERNHENLEEIFYKNRGKIEELSQKVRAAVQETFEDTTLSGPEMAAVITTGLSKAVSEILFGLDYVARCTKRKVAYNVFMSTFPACCEVTYKLLDDTDKDVN